MKRRNFLILFVVLVTVCLTSRTALANRTAVIEPLSHKRALAAPILTVTTFRNSVTASWTTIAGATGYTLLYARYPYTGADSIVSVDMGNQTGISVNLWGGAAFYVAVQAYNSAGSSGYSNIEYFIIGSSILVIPTTLSITVAETGICTIRNGTGPYSASSGNSSVATVSVGASTLSVTGISAGSSTIMVSDSGSDAVTVAVSVAESLSIVSRVDLPKTGQTTCYDTNGNVMPCEGTGQDGDIQAGVAWPKSRFTDNGDGTITDQLTGLMWTKAANIVQGTWQEALDYVAGMNAGTHENFGYTGWRLPNIREIESLIDAAQHNPALPSNHPFVGVQGAAGNYVFWSSTTESLESVGSPSITAYALSLTSGDSCWSNEKINLNSIWPVRSGESGVIQLPKTGQTTCWDSEGNTISCNGTGQDGDLKVGVAWPDPRFTDNGDGTVTDNFTDLMWTKDANPPDERLTWQEALDYIAEMNKGNHQNFGYTDWRLPNRKEFQSLADYQDWFPSLPVNHPFVNLGGYPHHTSTSNAGEPANACEFCVWGGRVCSSYDKSFEDYTWPVRGGQYADDMRRLLK